MRSSPAGANVTIGGVYRGRTPLDVAVRPDVPQAVAVSRDGYTGATREISVGSGARQVVELALTPILGDVIQLQQVVMNLMLNAFAAMDRPELPTRRLLVRTRAAADGS